MWEVNDDIRKRSYSFIAWIGILIPDGYLTLDCVYTENTLNLSLVSMSISNLYIETGTLVWSIVMRMERRKKVIKDGRDLWISMRPLLSQERKREREREGQEPSKENK